MKVKILGFFLWVLTLLISKTLRLRVIDYHVLEEIKDEQRRIIFSFWHQEFFLFFHYYRNNKVTILTSPSRDGDMLAEVCMRFGYNVVRGSSRSRGMRGMVELLRCVNDGWDLAWAVDGPLGPPGVVKPGVLYLAKKSGAVILPVAGWARHNIKFTGAWDRFMLPLPFSKATIVFGTPVNLKSQNAPNLLDAGVEVLQKNLEEASERAKKLCDS